MDKTIETIKSALNNIQYALTSAHEPCQGMALVEAEKQLMEVLEQLAKTTS